MMLPWAAAASSTVNKLTLHNVEGADGKAMVRLSLWILRGAEELWVTCRQSGGEIRKTGRAKPTGH